MTSATNILDSKIKSVLHWPNATIPDKIFRTKKGISAKCHF